MFFRKKNKNKIKILNEKKSPVSERKQSHSSFSLARIFFYVLAIVFLATVIYLLFFSMYLSINSIEITGAEKVDAEKIRIALMEKFSGKFLGVIPKNNLFFVNEKNIKKYLTGRFNRIEDVNISRIFPEKIIVSLKEKQFLLIFKTGEKEYLIGKNGLFWEKNDFKLNDSEEENLLILTDKSATNITEARAMLNDDFIKYLSDIREKIQRETDIEITHNFYSPRLISGDVEIETKDGWKIYLSREVDLAKSIGIFQSILSDKIKKEDISKLEYLDLRINNKVFYKFKNSEKTTENKPDENKNNQEKKEN